jgi:hypothetical protein
MLVFTYSTGYADSNTKQLFSNDSRVHFLSLAPRCLHLLRTRQFSSSMLNSPAFQASDRTVSTMSRRYSSSLTPTDSSKVSDTASS